MSEIWKDIPDYEGYYQISNHGQVKSLQRSVQGYRKKEMYLKLENTKGYRRVTLCKNAKTQRFLVHRLVARLFIPNPENKPEINHIDGIKHNNFVENLEWCTSSENTLHAHRTGLATVYKGEDHCNAKLKNHDIQEIFRMRENGKTLKEIGNYFNVSFQLISRILLKERRVIDP